jgi:hypothetical protein
MVRGVKFPESATRSGRKRKARPVQVLPRPSLPPSDEQADRTKRTVSDAEIGQLISTALDDALAALGNRNPETFLRLRACEAREAIREMLPTLRRERTNTEASVREYWKTIAFQNIELDLALALVSCIQRYAQVSQREIPDRPTAPHQI